MHRSIRGSSLLVGVCLLAGTGALAQRVPGAANQSQVSTDLAVTYATERAELAPGKCGCFWLQGGGVDAAVTFWKGLGLPNNASNTQNDLRLAFGATWRLGKR